MASRKLAHGGELPVPAAVVTQNLRASRMASSTNQPGISQSGGECRTPLASANLISYRQPCTIELVLPSRLSPAGEATLPNRLRRIRGQHYPTMIPILGPVRLANPDNPGGALSQHALCRTCGLSRDRLGRTKSGDLNSQSSGKFRAKPVVCSYPLIPMIGSASGSC